VTTAFDPANEVERLMLEAHADSGAMTAFLQALAAGQAWVPDAGSGAGSIRTVAAGETLSLPTWQAESGERFVPLFTSEELLVAASAEGTPFVRLDVAALLDTLDPEAWLGINPRSPLGMLMPANAVRDATGAQQIGEGSAYAIGEPAEEPAALLDDLRSWFAEDEPAVARAWRGLIVMDPRGGGKPEPLIGLELAPNTDADAIFAAAVRRVKRHGHGAVVLVAVDPEAPEGPATWLLERTQPFYERGPR